MKEYHSDNIHLFNCDNMELMKTFKDNEFDLAIVDPPYGINFGKFNRTNTDCNGNRFKANKYKNSDWDNSVPNDDYFNELQRISKNQIVFGGNYFIQLSKKETPNLKTIKEFLEYIENSNENWLLWYKQNPVTNFADCELAWLSEGLKSSQFNFKYYGNLQGGTIADDKIHPTQKPYQLYEYIISTYCNPNFKIIDTHFGSGSHGIAVEKSNTLDKMGLELTGIELDEEYFDAAVNRIKIFKMQKNTFLTQPP